MKLPSPGPGRSNVPASCCRIILACLVFGALVTSHAEVLINEICFNPPGTDAPNEYIELRGTPNLFLIPGTFLVSVQGDAGGDPGTIQNVFDLSGEVVGGNGFIALLQSSNTYSANPRATILVNTGSGPGWGSGTSGSIGHQGAGGSTDVKNPSVTFFLIQTTNRPAPGDDIDPGNTGVAHGTKFAAWTVLDSVGILDPDGAGDMAYGAINFRLRTAPGNGAAAGGTVVGVDSVPRYVGRTGNTKGAAAADWVASGSLNDSASGWLLGADTVPAAFAGGLLDHIGSPNFLAAPIPGIVVSASPSPEVTEDGATAAYSLQLNTAPTGPVQVRISAGPQLQVSNDGGGAYAAETIVSFSIASPRQILVRAVDDGLIQARHHLAYVTNAIASTGDPAHYPLSTLPGMAQVSVGDNDVLLLNELRLNPPGTNDTPYAFVEIRGLTTQALTDVQLLALSGEPGSNRGEVLYSLALSAAHLGTNGLAVICTTNRSFDVDPNCALITDPEFNAAYPRLAGRTVSFLLISSSTAIHTGDDLDPADDGKLPSLPADSIIDSLSFSTGAKGEITYGGGVLTLKGRIPDAATRLPANDSPSDSSAWAFGELASEPTNYLMYDPLRLSSSAPPGTALTPGATNRVAPKVSPIAPICGVIGDTNNPVVRFSLESQLPGLPLQISAVSSNASVVPATNLLISPTGGGNYELTITPVGVGYSEITVLASDGVVTGWVAFEYAASDPGRPGGAWHIGASDGSTGISVDGEYMIVGDDENQVLRLYPRDKTDLPTRRFDFTSFLGLPDIASGRPREVDIEASTRSGNRIFWMGSHGHAAIGETRTNRTRVFATDLAGLGTNATLSYIGRYDYLKVDLIEWDRNNQHGLGSNYFGLEASDAEGVPPKAPDGSGFAIEGLSMLPGSSNAAYIGFRAPIVAPASRDYALLVPVLNFAEVAAGNGPPGSCAFGAPIQLDLYGRGIRSLESGTNGIIIVAGPPFAGTATYPHDFRVYTWSGKPGEPAFQRLTDLTGLNPEGLVEVPPEPWTPETPIQLISDEGATVFYGDGVAAKNLKDPNFKKCRSDRIALGGTTKPMPFIESVDWHGGSLTVHWRALAGERYRIQATGALFPADWTDVTEDIRAEAPHPSVQLSPTTSKQFFRVRLVQPGA